MKRTGFPRRPPRPVVTFAHPKPARKAKAPAKTKRSGWIKRRAKAKRAEGYDDPAYRGSFDDKQDGPTKHFVADAVDAVLAGKAPEVTSTKAFGCGVQPNNKQ